jgi:hypothetical protein
MEDCEYGACFSKPTVEMPLSMYWGNTIMFAYSWTLKPYNDTYISLRFYKISE